MRSVRLFVLFCVLALIVKAERLDLGWPTPNHAFMEGRGITAFVQPTASGVLESGCFGSVRSGGSQFHEGVDLKPVNRDRHGEPSDPVFAAMKGIVRHVSRSPGDSNYGRYVVLEHPDAHPCVYTLYAHLAVVDPSIRDGAAVEKGAVLGVMGRSSSSMAIPRDRAHLHFEIGLWLTRDFQSWYAYKKFGSPNDHGIFNGMNLVGVDPVDFFEKWKDRRINDAIDYFRAMPAAVKVRVVTKRIPDFVDRYPELLTKPLPADRVIGGFDVSINSTGVPFAFTPLSPLEGAGVATGEVRVLTADETLLRHERGKHLAVMKRGKWTAGRDLMSNLELVFGLRGR